MSKVFRAKYIAELRKSDLNIPKKVYNVVFGKKWVVHAKQPFGSPKHVIEYLGKYTHKKAIGNHRITGVDSKKQECDLYCERLSPYRQENQFDGIERRVYQEIKTTKKSRRMLENN